MKRSLVVVPGLVLLAVLGAGCSNGTDQGAAACAQVNLGLTTYAKAVKAGLDTPRGADLLAKAQSQVEAAKGTASLAASSDGTFNALMTTIGETGRVPFKDLVDALSASCSAANNSFAPNDGN